MRSTNSWSWDEQIVTGEKPYRPRVRKSTTNKTEDKNLGRLQDLVGRALSDYQNDRAPDRAERVTASLQEAFDLILRMRSSS